MGPCRAWGMVLALRPGGPARASKAKDHGRRCSDARVGTGWGVPVTGGDAIRRPARVAMRPRAHVDRRVQQRTARRVVPDLSRSAGWRDDRGDADPRGRPRRTLPVRSLCPLRGKAELGVRSRPLLGRDAAEDPLRPLVPAMCEQPRRLARRHARDRGVARWRVRVRGLRQLHNPAALALCRRPRMGGDPREHQGRPLVPNMRRRSASRAVARPGCRGEPGITSRRSARATPPQHGRAAPRSGSPPGARADRARPWSPRARADST